MLDLLRDLKHGFRMLAQQPVLSAISIVAFTLGIGLTTTTFSIVYGAILRGLPFEDAHELMHLERSNLSEGINSMEVTQHDFVDWVEQQDVFEGLAAFRTGTVNLSSDDQRPERYDGAFISANALEQLRVSPALGRWFTEEEDRPGASGVVVIGHSVWRDRYGSDPDVIGRAIRVNGEASTIIGVMGEGFEFPLAQDVWVPLAIDLTSFNRGGGNTLEVYGRLREGVSQDQAVAGLQSIAARLALEYPETNEGVTPVVKPYAQEYIDEEAVALLSTMLAAVFMVLLMACVNVANLLLSRAVERTREIAVRTALGASRWRIVSQLVGESLALASIGGLFGIVLSFGGVAWFNNQIVDTGAPFWIDIRVDGAALGVVLGLVALASIASGLLPAAQASGADINEVLKDENRGSSSFKLGRFSRGLVMFEIALSCGLLFAAGLVAKSVIQLGNIEYAFATDDILTGRVGLFETDYPDAESRLRFWRSLQDELSSRSGIEHASLSTNLPGNGHGVWSLLIEGEEYESPEDYDRARVARVTPGFFETLNAELLDGRTFTWQDAEGAMPVAIVNEPFAVRHFPDQSPIGKRFRLGGPETDNPWITVVGLAPDMWMGDTDDNDQPEGLYLPLMQREARFVSVLVNPRAVDPMSASAELRDAVATIDRDIPVYWLDTLGEVLRVNTWFFRTFGVIFMTFGLAALFLASVGLYGVMSFSVSRRTQEMGIRMALGAGRGQLRSMVLRQGATQVVVGLVAGSAIAYFLGQFLTIVLYRVNGTDPWIAGAIITVLTVTGLVASLIPAARATRVDPMVALRYE